MNVKDKLLDILAWVIVAGTLSVIVWILWMGRHDGSLIAAGSVILIVGFFWSLNRIAYRNDRLQEESNVKRRVDNDREEARRVVEAHKKRWMVKYE